MKDYNWVNALIGIPWTFNGRGLHTGFDCWGLFKYVQEHYFNVKVGEIICQKNSLIAFAKSFKDNKEYNNWILTDKPVDGTAVILGTNKLNIHIGIWINNGILHSIEASGVIFTPHSNLYCTKWKINNYYKYEKTINHNNT